MPDKSVSGSRIRGVAWTLIAVLFSVTIAVSSLTDWPARMGLRASVAADGEHDEHDGDQGHRHAEEDDASHGGHRHDDPGDDAEEDSIELSPQARDSLGLQTEAVSASSFTQFVSMPGTIMDWPGRTHVSVTAPLTGVVSAIYISQGELIRSGQPLFSMRLTHQDLVKAQSDFLAALGRMDVENREITRLTSVARSGAIAGKTLIQREYERDKLQAEIQADRQAMLLHGLTEDQIASIERDRKLVREVTIFAPVIHGDNSLHHDSEHDHPHGGNHGDGDSGGDRDPPLPPGDIQQAAYTAQLRAGPETEPHEHLEAEFLVTQVNVNRGQSVEAGNPLGRLSDYSHVLIEGHAFQRDAQTLKVAANLQLPIQAVFESAGTRPEIIDGLRISYISSEVELDTRALPFFVSLENKVERSEQRGDARYVSWRFKPGQRPQLRVPIQVFDNTIVVPKDAVAEEGLERYVFVDHGDHLDRRPVRVVARDAFSVAIANDGSIRKGERIALNGAHQLQMAVKKKSGGPIDPHGHTH